MKFLQILYIIFALVFNSVKKIKSTKLKIAFWVAAAITAAVVLVSGFNVNMSDGEAISIDTEYGRVIIEDEEYNGDLVFVGYFYRTEQKI